MSMLWTPDTSREDTTRCKVSHLTQMPLGACPGSRKWVNEALRLFVADSTEERHLVALICKRRHYAERWPVRPRSKYLGYLGTLGGDSAACMLMVALQGTQCRLVASVRTARRH